MLEQMLETVSFNPHRILTLLKELQGYYLRSKQPGTTARGLNPTKPGFG
jgi:hypothetical protein